MSALRFELFPRSRCVGDNESMKKVTEERDVQGIGNGYSRR